MADTREPDRIHYHEHGRTLIWETVTPDGALRVQQDDQAVRVTGHDDPVAYMPVQRAVWLDGDLILDPDRAKMLAAAGLFTDEGDGDGDG